MNTLKKDIELILGLHIQEDNWQDSFMAADVQGKLTNKRTNDMIRILCEHVMALESKNE